LCYVLISFRVPCFLLVSPVVCIAVNYDHIIVNLMCQSCLLITQDLRTLRTLATYLIAYDAITFLAYLEVRASLFWRNF